MSRNPKPTAIDTFFGLLEESAGLGFWEWDAQEDRVRYSPSCSRIYKVRHGSIRTLGDWLARVHPEDRERLMNGPAFQGESKITRFSSEFRICIGKNKIRWVLDQGHITRNRKGQVTRVVGINLDITERKLMEEQLRLQSSAMQFMAEGINLATADGRIIYANDQFETMYGYLPGELVGKHCVNLKSPSDSDPEAAVNDIIAYLKADGVWRGEVLNRRKNGEDFWVHASISVFQHASWGEVWIAVVSDITEWRRLNQERQAAFLQLERLTREIQDAEERLRSTLSREVHDEIGAQLTAVRMKLDALAHSNCQPGPKEPLRQLLAQIDTAMANTREICTRLRPPVLDHLDLHGVLRWLLDDWSAKTGIYVRTRLARLPTDPGERVRTDLFRCVQELLTNVARHTRASEVKVILSQCQSTLRIVVADNGQGFSTPNTNTQGLGLVGIRERLKQHGGTLDMDSSAHGTTATITVPYLP
jgi:PAS domain S-box-containing protein